jgi:dienelactone hydrolase
MAALEEVGMKNLVFAITLLVATAGGASAGIHTETVEYMEGDAVLEGYLAYDDSVKGRRPGVLVVHEWMGLNDYARKRAEMLAGLGYVAFAADIYGKGIRAKDRKEAAGLSRKFKSNRKLLRARVNAGLRVLKNHSLADPARTAAVGYCFGGTAVLELARSGAGVAGVVSFHGGLDSPAPEDSANIRARVLALHGADDPIVKADEAAAFQEEMRRGGVDWQMVYYGGAVHSFTNPASGNDTSKGVAYDEKADRRSWEAMRAFFREIFK